VTGKRVYTSPHWSWSASVDWHMFENDFGNLDLYLDANGITKEYFNAANSPGSQQNGYSIWDARLTAETADGSKSISVWCQNLLDRKYYTVIFDTQSLVNYNSQSAEHRVPSARQRRTNSKTGTGSVLFRGLR